MQRLADMAGGVGATAVLVEKAAAGGEVKQRQTEQRSAEAPQTGDSRIFLEPQHRI